MILVTGANGVVGRPLQQILQAKKKEYFVVSRHEGEGRVRWDLSEPMSSAVQKQLQSIESLIHCAPIWLLPAHLEDLRQLGLRRLVAFSSSSVISKEKSSDPLEQQLVSQLADSEQAIRTFCSEHSIEFTILQPSMIYGYGRDQNVMTLANFIRRFGFVPIAGEANGERQPVHADDLAIACLFMLDNKRTYGKTYVLAGGEVLSYRAMLEKIFVGLDKKPRIVRLPAAVMASLLTLVSKFGRSSYSPEMAHRMNQNLSYDYTPATRDFGFMPRVFLQRPEQDLKQPDTEQ